MIPEDDIANMRDVADVMAPSEYLGWKIDRVMEYAMQSPVLESMMYI